MSFATRQQAQQAQQRAGDAFIAPIPTYEIQVRPTIGGEEILDGASLEPQIIRQEQLQETTMEGEEERAEQAMVVGHNETANTTMEQDMNTTNDDTINDSLAGNGADDEGEPAGSNETAGTSRRRTPRDLAVATRTIDTAELSQEAGFEIKPDGKSNKYPLLKVYYEFGPWVGRNRKAICVRCKHTSASSQPERLIRHLRRCVALTDEDRQVAEELLLVSDLNKKERKKSKRVALMASASNDDTDDYDEEETGTGAGTGAGTGGSQQNAKASIIALPPGGIKRPRRDSADRKKHVDQCLVRFIICNRIPLKSVHSKEFLDFVRSLDPDYRLPTRENITNNLIPGLLNI